MNEERHCTIEIRNRNNILRIFPNGEVTISLNSKGNDKGEVIGNIGYPICDWEVKIFAGWINNYHSGEYGETGFKKGKEMWMFVDPHID